MHAIIIERALERRVPQNVEQNEDLQWCVPPTRGVKGAVVYPEIKSSGCVPFYRAHRFGQNNPYCAMECPLSISYR